MIFDFLFYIYMFEKFLKKFGKDLGIDLGTANTLVYVKGKGIVINEPSIVALNQKTGQVLAIGQEAKKMVGKTPSHIVASKPLVGGVVSDFEITEQMLRYFIRKVHENGLSILSRPVVVIGIPSGVTEVEKRAVEDAARSAGAREVYLVEEPMAAASGAKLPIQEAAGNMIIDIGGGTTEVAIISLGGIVIGKSLRIAGNKFDQDIINYVRDEHKLLIGDRTAEEIKIAIGAAHKQEELLESPLRGRDLVSGLPKQITVNSEEIREALGQSLKTIVNAIKLTIEETPPELVSDIMRRGIILAGGGGLLRGLDKLLESEIKIPVRITDDPLTAVVRGAGVILEDIDSLKEVLVGTQYKEPPK